MYRRREGVAVIADQIKSAMFECVGAFLYVAYRTLLEGYTGQS